jgi:hypothetical protein
MYNVFLLGASGVESGKEIACREAIGRAED